MQSTGTVEQVNFESRALYRNRLGDPHIRKLHIYLPPGYQQESDRRYPVILMKALISSLTASSVREFVHPTL